VSLSPRLRFALLLAGIGAAATVVFMAVARSPEAVRDAVDGFGVAGPLMFVAVAAPLSCAFFPGPLLAGASGLLFGTALGTPVAVASGTAAAALAYTLSRHGGRPLVEEVAGPRTERWRGWVERRGFVAILYVRIAPGMPFTLVNYAAGLTRVPLAVFLAATAVGIAPRAFAYTALGGSLHDLGSPEAIAAFGVLAAMAATGLVLIARDRRRLRSAGPGTGSWCPAGRSGARP
jgi:uncharacterized membrane protein YdjX (TVP38/TMEM64 family)